MTMHALHLYVAVSVLRCQQKLFDLYESTNELYINEYYKYQALYKDVEINNARHHYIKPSTNTLHQTLDRDIKA